REGTGARHRRSDGDGGQQSRVRGTEHSRSGLAGPLEGAARRVAGKRDGFTPPLDVIVRLRSRRTDLPEDLQQAGRGNENDLVLPPRAEEARQISAPSEE